VTGLDDAASARRERNKALVRRYKLVILNGRQLTALDEVATDDYLDHAAFPGQAPGLAGFRERLEQLIGALDPRWTILDLVADTDTAVVRWALQGTHRDVFLGLSPTGRPVELRGIDMYRIRAGKLAEHWNVVDLSPLAGIARQSA
jgi:predicted ester cyclase